MTLFRNRGNVANILVRVGESCATNCHNCFDNRKPATFLPYRAFGPAIRYVSERFEDGFSLFFYGVESIWHPEIRSFLEDPALARFSPCLHITPIHTPERTERIRSLAAERPGLAFDTCYYVTDPSEFVGVVRFLEFAAAAGIRATVDLFCDFPTYLRPFAERFGAMGFSYRKNTAPSHLHMPFNLEFTLGDLVVELYQMGEQRVADGRITGLPNRDCLVRRMFRITDDGHVDVLEELEVDHEGNLKVHMNAYCSRAIRRISRIDRTDERVLEDFRELNRRLEKYDSGDMGKNCHDCMTSPLWID